VRSLRQLLSRSPGPQPDARDPLLETAADEDRRIVERVMPYTLTGSARLFALVDAVRYCNRLGLRGAFVECGVWRGGSVLAMILTLQDMGVSDRDIYLYDTFEGMTAPTAHDVGRAEGPAHHEWEAAQERGERPWAELYGEDVVDEASVRETVLSSGYPEKRLHFVRGPVEKTIPGQAPAEIALLRLDTDWYESTRHELEHLYPRLANGGPLIIDDYGHWEGCRRAVDEYFDGVAAPILLSRLDYSGRMAVKR
jgi:hypothetical protein